MRALLLTLFLTTGCAAPSKILSDPPGATISIRDIPRGEAPVSVHFSDPWGEWRFPYADVSARWPDGREARMSVTPNAGLLGDQRWPRRVRISAP